MIELLKLCGFEVKEIEVELPRVENAFKRLGITAEDIERAKQRLVKYYDIELQGVRKALRLCIREVVDLVLAREEGKKKIIYAFMTPGFATLSSALVSKSREVYAAHLCQQFQLVLGSIFGKLVPILEAAEQRWLKAGVVAHCGNVKTLVGLITSDFVPRPDLMSTSGILCDTAPKTINLLHELYNIPTCCYDTCQDRESREYPVATRRIVDLAAKSMRSLGEKIQEVVGFEITDDMLREVVDARSQLGDSIRKLENLIENSDPLPINANHALLWGCLDLLTLSIDSLPDAIDAIDTLCEELQERVNRGVGVVEKGAPRILAMLPTHYSDPRLDHLISELGIAIATTDAVFIMSEAGRKGEGLKDPYEVMSRSNVEPSLAHCPQIRIPLIIEKCKRLNVDGVLNRYHVGCRTVAGDALIIQDAVTKELDIPVLSLRRDDFDPRVYDEEQHKSELKSFRDILTSNRQPKQSLG